MATASGAILYGGGVERHDPGRAAAATRCCGSCDLLMDAAAPAGAPLDRPGALLTPRLRDIKRRSLVFIVSDFISRPGWERPLPSCSTADTRSLADPGLGPARGGAARTWAPLMEDAETGEQLYVDTHDGGSASASRRRPASARRALVGRRSSAPAWMPSPSPPRTTWWARSSGSPPGAPAGGGARCPSSGRLLLLLPRARGRSSAYCGRWIDRRRARLADWGAWVWLPRPARGSGRAAPRAEAALRSSSRGRDPGRGARAAAGRGQPAAPGGHRDPRVRRVGQHGRDRLRADAHGGGQGRRDAVRRAAATGRGRRRGRLQRQRPVGPGPHQRPGRRAGGHRPSPPPRGHLALARASARRSTPSPRRGGRGPRVLHEPLAQRPGRSGRPSRWPATARRWSCC